MQTPSPPLLARLRRRLAASVWLFALLVVAKATIAVGCANEQLATSTSPDTATIASVHESASITLPGSTASASDTTDAERCWHDGSNGCHCACAHSSPLPGVLSDMATPNPGSFEFPATFVLPILARRESALRPPIA
ncbi:MAG: hypothetical protein ABIS07_08690 [Dokdonella sp.]